jgi:hypothetical protein
MDTRSGRKKLFLEEMEERLEENRKLAGGGLPVGLAVVANWLGTRLMESLMVLALAATTAGFLVVPEIMLKIVKGILLIK